MMRWLILLVACSIFGGIFGGVMTRNAWAQALGMPDRQQPGDKQIQDYLRRLAEENFGQFAADITSLADWQERRSEYHRQLLYMLGLSPLPDKSPLQATVTGTVAGEGYTVDLLHYQSLPGLYVTGNLYRPTDSAPGDKLPAVLYVCGHSGMGRNGNKTAYQSHGIWFARHGYVCLVVDTLQLGEIAAIHHGTYREQRWWWHSRGYTSAGVECWNGIRGIDYLLSRDDVDPARLAVTGISGGGAATFWIAAADDRVRVAVPVSGMADLLAYVPNRVINGHCDCMFLHNTFNWPWVRIAALIAPRPLLFVNSDQDPIFPMDANERVIAQLERLYSLHGAGDDVDAMVSVGGHAYRADIRAAAYRFINLHLKGDGRPVTDSEVDLVTESGSQRNFPITPEKLRVFPDDQSLPRDQINTTIDETFVPLGETRLPEAGHYDDWRKGLIHELQTYVLRALPVAIPAASIQKQEGRVWHLETEPGIVVPLELVHLTPGVAPTEAVLYVVTDQATRQQALDAAKSAPEHEMILTCTPRGYGVSAWTRKNPPNYVERSHVLLGTTVDTGRVRDIVATFNGLKARHPEMKVTVKASGTGATLATIAAVCEPAMTQLSLQDPVWNVASPHAPQLLNLLRVTDYPTLTGILAPRQLELRTTDPSVTVVQSLYKAAGAESQLKLAP